VCGGWHRRCRQWSDLSERTRRLLAITAVAEGALRLAALIDLKRRPASQVRGPKWVYLTERPTDEGTARMVQLGIEYDPKPPHGGIQWSNVDRDIYAPVIAQQLSATLADNPELLAKLAF
jgi:hypothetical protein